MEAMTDFLFLGSKFTVMVTAAMKLKDTCFFQKEGKLCPTYTACSKAETSLADKVPYSQSYGFFSSHGQM